MIFNPVVQVPVQTQIANSVIVSGNQLYMQLVQAYKQSYNAVWYNKQAAPPAIVAAMGPNAQAFFAASSGLAQYLNTLKADSVPATIPAEWQYTANVDGSLLVTAKQG